MRHLFSPAGEASLVATMALRPLLAFDFDGTLAPIVARPDDARVPVALVHRLERLARMLPLAIVSGRRVDDLRGRLTFEPRYVIGNHGAEDPSRPGTTLVSILDGLRSRLELHAGALSAAGVLVEDKGQSIALHYRLAPDRPRAQEVVSYIAQTLEPGLAAFGGKLVMNIVAAGAPDKADAVAGLVRRAGAEAAVFLGDDLNDEPVFASAEPSWLSVKVCRDDASSLAMYYLEGLGEVETMLDRMLECLDRVADDATP